MYRIDLEKFLERKKIKQAELARILDTTPANVNRWAKNEGVPSYDLCAKLLEIGMTTEELFGITITPDTNIDDLDARVRSIIIRALQKN